MLKMEVYPIVYIKELEVYGMVLGSYSDVFKVAYPAYEDNTGWYVVVRKEPDSKDDRIEYNVEFFKNHELKFNV